MGFLRVWRLCFLDLPNRIGKPTQINGDVHYYDATDFNGDKEGGGNIIVTQHESEADIFGIRCDI